MNKQNELVQMNNYSVKKMIFSKPIVSKIPNSQVTYKRIYINTKNADNTVGNLILPTADLFSFGINENINPETQQVSGYVLPLCLWSLATLPEEKAFTDVFERIVEHCKKHLVKNREEIGVHDLEMNDLKKFNPLYWRKERGKLVENRGPTLYTKLNTDKSNKIITPFFDKEGKDVNHLDYQDKYCRVKAAIKIESIYISGAKIALQVKLYEAEISPLETSRQHKPLLKRRTNAGVLLPSATQLPLQDSGSVSASSSEETDNEIEVELE